MNTRELALEELEKVTGGTAEDLERYWRQLYAKYGIAYGDQDSLMNAITDEEFKKALDEFEKPGV